jgi:hypothetical protein
MVEIAQVHSDFFGNKQPGARRGRWQGEATGPGPDNEPLVQCRRP